MSVYGRLLYRRNSDKRGVSGATRHYVGASYGALGSGKALPVWTDPERFGQTAYHRHYTATIAPIAYTTDTIRTNIACIIVCINADDDVDSICIRVV